MEWMLKCVFTLFFLAAGFAFYLMVHNIIIFIWQNLRTIF